MSSKVIKAKPNVFSLGLNDAKSAAVGRLCSQLGITYIRLMETDRKRKVGEIAHHAEQGIMLLNSSQQDVQPSPELLVFSELTESKLDEFLAEYRKAGIEPIALKAVVTPHNAEWTIDELTAELIKEHTAVFLNRK